MAVEDFASAARALVGTPFRPQGRDPLIGLDCIGLVIATFKLNSERFRRDYRLRGLQGDALAAGLESEFRRVPAGRRREGDVLLCRVSGEQWHLAVQTGAGFVHADAGIGRVVETPGDPAWPITAVYRRPAKCKKGSK